jgi:phage-related protein
MIMYEVEFYRDRDGNSEIVDYLDDLKSKSATSKTDRINHDKILAYMIILKQFGTRIGQPVVKHIDGNIWELRPLKNRIFFFYWKDNTFILLHHFIKKTKKTPPREIDMARAKMKDFLDRKEKDGELDG